MVPPPTLATNPNQRVDADPTWFIALSIGSLIFGPTLFACLAGFVMGRMHRRHALRAGWIEGVTVWLLAALGTAGIEFLFRSRTHDVEPPLPMALTVAAMSLLLGLPTLLVVPAIARRSSAPSGRPEAMG